MQQTEMTGGEAAAAPSPIGTTAALGLAVRKIEDIAMVLSALSVAGITLLVCLEVVVRAAFGASTLIATEMSSYLLASNVFLGLAWTFREGGFIRVDLVHAHLRGRVAAFVNLAIAVLGTVVLVVYTWYLWRLLAQNFHTGATSIYVSRTPLWIPQTVLPLGSALLTIAMFGAALRAGRQLFHPAPEDDVARPAAELESWL